MPPKKKIITNVNKIYFVIFLVVTIILIILFLLAYIKPYWDYWSVLRISEKFYQHQIEQANLATPQIRQFDPVYGPVDAQVTVYEFTDFFCPACTQMQTDLVALEKYYGNKIRFVYKGIPVTVNDQARPAITAVYCASDQANFWPYKQLLFTDPNNLNKEKYLAYASQLNLDLEAFSQCLNSGKFDQVIDRNLAEASSLQISAIPTIYINEQKFEGLINYNQLKKAIDQKL